VATEDHFSTLKTRAIIVTKPILIGHLTWQRAVTFYLGATQVCWCKAIPVFVVLRASLTCPTLA